jgi:hypothetical protein
MLRDPIIKRQGSFAFFFYLLPLAKNKKARKKKTGG